MRQGRRYRFRQETFWAERGMICIENRHTGDFECLTVRQFLAQLDAVNQGISRIPDRYWDEREEHHAFVSNGIQACREAKAQGRPDDPKAVADMIKAHRSTQVLLSGSSAVPYIIQASEHTPLPPYPERVISH
jgi:hypothetical protein